MVDVQVKMVLYTPRSTGANSMSAGVNKMQQMGRPIEHAKATFASGKRTGTLEYNIVTAAIRQNYKKGPKQVNTHAGQGADRASDPVR